MHFLVVATAVFLILVHGMAHGAAPTGSKKDKTVWAVLFVSRDCPKCEGVRTLVEELKKKYPMKVKGFSIDRVDAYNLFRRIEAVHGQDRFSVPLMMVGDTILKGEKQILEQLEPTVRKLAASGGAALPYLGPGKDTGKVKSKTAQGSTAQDPPCPECDRKGRPPSVGEEWLKIRRFFEKLF